LRCLPLDFEPGHRETQRQGGREAGRERGRAGERQGGREAGRERGREGERQGGREAGRERASCSDGWVAARGALQSGVREGGKPLTEKGKEASG